MSSFAEENYLKAIYKLSERTEGEIYTNDIAKRMQTSAASVTDMLKKLAKKKFINYQRYKGISLTELGIRTALGVIRKHRLWEMFLVKVLGFKWDEVHEVAEQLEHVRSEKLIQHIDKFLNYPKFDPHGDPIPDMHGNFGSKQKPFSLSEGKTNQKYIMNGVVDHSTSFLNVLDKLGVSLGVKMTISSIQSYDRSLHVQLNSKEKIFLSNQIAKNILVLHDKNK
ncbi:MAG TPA: metal-dependent transcriptional regulator [Bacteroidia bacterium]|nr:metal-dependent transcriptional regulator [Bacteroidia bacterium]